MTNFIGIDPGAGSALVATFVIEVPLPPRELSPNTPVFRMKKAYVIAMYRGMVETLARAQVQAVGWVAPERARITLSYATKGSVKAGLYGPRDWDNAAGAFKAGQDALVRAGVLVADDAAHLEGSVTFDRKHGPWVRVTIEALV